jgi:hypothetical protein
VADLNDRPMRKLGVSRRQLFEQLDRPTLASPTLNVYAEAAGDQPSQPVNS